MQINRVMQKLVFTLLIAVTALRPAVAFSEQQFVVESVTTQLNETVYFLNTVFEINLPGYISDAVDQGFDLPLAMEIEVYKQRRFWFDEKVVYIKQQYRLNYHALLDAVSIFDINAGSRKFFLSLDEAIQQMSVLLSYPLLDNNDLSATHRYSARLRFGIDNSEIPLPLKSSSFWENDWSLISDWYEWELTQ